VISNVAGACGRTTDGRKRPLHTIIPAFMEKDDIHIGFGIMGGWNQAQAHAQFVANVVDYGMNVQAALEQPRFTKGTFEGCDVQMENTIPRVPIPVPMAKRFHTSRLQSELRDVIKRIRHDEVPTPNIPKPEQF
jgi:gamma-glutamyltranspeptidase